MTVIINVTTAGETLQVSDRLVTLSVNGAYAGVKDAYANKAVVFRARDGIVCIGYAGLAYLDGTPTDTRIAEIICHRELRGDWSLHAWLDPRREWRWPDIGTALTALADALSGHLSNRPPCERGLLSLLVSGWQVAGKGNRIRPVCYELHNNRDRGTFQIRSMYPRHWAWDRTAQFTWIPRLQEDVKAWFQAEADRITATQRTYQDLMVEAIRRTAASSPTVGADCMSVLIRAFVAPHVVVRYLPHQEKVLKLQMDDSTTIDSPVAYSPWIVTEGAVQAPSLILGERTLGLTNLETRLVAPSPPGDSGLLQWDEPQLRPGV